MKLYNIFIKNDKPQIKNKPKIKSPNFIKLRDWVQKDRLNWEGLSSNPAAVHLLEEKLEDDIPSKINWEELSSNPAAIHLLEANPSKICWKRLSRQEHPEAIKLLKANQDKIDWDVISHNVGAIELIEVNMDKIKYVYLPYDKELNYLLEANPDKVCFYYLITNQDKIKHLEANPSIIDWKRLSGNVFAISLLEANQDKIDWKILSGNLAAIKLLEANPNKIDWDKLSKNPGAIKLLEANPNKINWEILSGNPAAIKLLEANLDKICWWRLSDDNFCNLINNNLHNIDIIIDNEDDIMCKYHGSSDYNIIYILEKLIHKLKWYNISFTKDEYENYVDFLFCGPCDIVRRRTEIQIIKSRAAWSWYWLSQNPAIFTYDYPKIKETRQQINKEICEKYWHPKRMDLWMWQEDE